MDVRPVALEREAWPARLVPAWFPFARHPGTEETSPVYEGTLSPHHTPSAGDGFVQRETRMRFAYRRSPPSSTRRSLPVSLSLSLSLLAGTQVQPRCSSFPLSLQAGLAGCMASAYFIPAMSTAAFPLSAHVCLTQNLIDPGASRRALQSSGSRSSFGGHGALSELG